MSVLALVFGLFIVGARISDVSYYLFGGDTVKELGDVRENRPDAATLQSFETNDFVSFKNDVILFDELKSSDGKYSFYYSPLTKFIVRTSRVLPALEDDGSIIEINTSHQDLIIDKIAFPQNLAVSFDGSGRFVKGEDAPEWARQIMEFMANSSGDSVDSINLLFDGDTPDSYAVYGMLFAVALFLLLLTLLFWGLALRKLLAVKNELNRLKKMGIDVNE